MGSKLLLAVSLADIRELLVQCTYV